MLKLESEELGVNVRFYVESIADSARASGGPRLTFYVRDFAGRCTPLHFTWRADACRVGRGAQATAFVPAQPPGAPLEVELKQVTGDRCKHRCAFFGMNRACSGSFQLKRQSAYKFEVCNPDQARFVSAQRCVRSALLRHRCLTNVSVLAGGRSGSGWRRQWALDSGVGEQEAGVLRVRGRAHVLLSTANFQMLPFLRGLSSPCQNNNISCSKCMVCSAYHLAS